MESNSTFAVVCLMAWLCVAARGMEPPKVANDSATQPAITVETADRRAREAVLAFLQSPKNQHYREAYRLRVPDRPTGLPSSYNIEAYGDTGCLGGPELMQIEVRRERASGRWVDETGIYHGKVPCREIDDCVRQMVYLHVAEEDRLATESLALGGGGSSPASYVIRLVSRDSTAPFRLRTQAYHVYPYSEERLSLSSLYEWIRGRSPRGPLQVAKQFGHNRLMMALSGCQDREPARGEPSDKTRQEVLSWLKSGHKETEWHNAPLRIDRKAVLLNLAVPLAIRWRLQPGVEILRARGLTTEASELEIAVCDHPTELLKAALTGSDTDLRDWAIGFLSESVSATVSQEVLAYALPRIRDPIALSVILADFKKKPSNAMMLSAVHSIYSTRSDDHDLWNTAAEYLLRQTKKTEYYDALVTESLKFTDTPYSWLTSPCDAACVLTDFSVESGLKQRETGAMARTLLSRISKVRYDSGGAARPLLIYLASLRDPSDLELLRGFLGHEDGSLVAAVVWAMATIQPEAAIAAARLEVAKALVGEDKEREFYWRVEPYLDLFFWQEDRAAIKLLERAIQSLDARKPEEAEEFAQARTRAQRLLGWLRARRIEDRVQCAVEYAKGCRLSKQCRQEIVDRLIREGGDPKRCAVLMEGEDYRFPSALLAQ